MLRSLRLLVLLWLGLTVIVDARKPSSKVKNNLNNDDPIVRNNRPIIGILAQEIVGKSEIFGVGQYVGASYVKMVESGGARAVPILVDQSDEEIEKLFYSLNGVILPGGHPFLNESRYGAVGQQLFELAMKTNRAGKVFPIWAECMGFEMIALLVTGHILERGAQFDNNLLTPTDALNYRTTLKLHEPESSFLYSNIPKKLLQFMETEKFAYNNHIKGITPEAFNQNKKLKSMFRITSTAKDRYGYEFVATAEGRQYPFFLLHWHPSKTQFEWSENLDFYHSLNAVRVAQKVFEGFMAQAVQSDHKFPSALEERTALIYNYSPTYTGRLDTFMQTYFFPNRLPYKTKFLDSDILLIRKLGIDLEQPFHSPEKKNEIRAKDNRKAKGVVKKKQVKIQ